MRRNKDDGNLHTCVGQLSLKIKAAGAREPHIENEATGSIGAAPGKEFLSAVECLRAQSHGFQKSLNGATNRWIVVYYEYR